MLELSEIDLVEASRDAGVRDARVLEALAAVPRAEFVPIEHVDEAYSDRPLPISYGQVTTQPSLVAKMVEALALTGTERVLEIGTGHGFQTAVLGHLARSVWSVEIRPELAEAGAANLVRRGVRNAHVVVADGSEGLPDHAPYDAILVAAAFPEVPPPLVDQLADGGRLVQPIGYGGAEEVVLFERSEGRLERRAFVTGAHFVRLHGRHGFPLGDR